MRKRGKKDAPNCNNNLNGYVYSHTHIPTSFYY